MKKKDVIKIKLPPPNEEELEIHIDTVVPTTAAPQAPSSPTGQIDLFAGIPYEVPKHYMQPSGDTFRAMFKVQSLGEKLADKEALATMKQRKHDISHSASVAVANVKGKDYEVTFGKGNEKVKITVTNLKALCGKNTGTMRIFKLITGEISKHCLVNGQLVTKYLKIDRRLLTDLHIYKNQDTALKGWKETMQKLASMKFTLEGRSRLAVVTMFPTLDFDTKDFVVVLNDTLPWGSLVQGLAYTPTWTLDQQLGINTFVLSDYIFDQIRIKKNELVPFRSGADGKPEAAYFDLKLVNLQEVLNLPSCEAAKSNAAKYVKKPILDAVAEFNEAADRNKDEQVKLSILPSADASPKDTTQQWLENNGLRVYVQGRLLEEMLKLCEQHTLRIEENTAKKQLEMTKKAN